MNGEPMRPQPKVVRPPREPKRLKQVSDRRAARIAAGEEQPGMKRTWMKRHPTVDPTQDEGKLAFVRSQPCVGLAFFPGHKCWGANTASHLRDHTGTGRRESSEWACCMCWTLHLEEWEAKCGPFAGWTQEQRVEWMRERCVETHDLWLALPEERRTWWREVGAQRRGVDFTP